MLLDGTIDDYSVTYIKNINDTIPLASCSAVVTSPQPVLQWMAVMLLDPPDGSHELLVVDDSFTDPQLLPSSHDNVVNLLYFTGEAAVDVYLNALQSVHYTNTKNVPTPGNRAVVVIVYDGVAYGRTEIGSLIVLIHNLPPVITLSGNEDSYYNRYFPNRQPVPAISPSMASILDDDSGSIVNVTLQILNAIDTPYEMLTITYRSPERVTTPIIREMLNINLPFGTLWEGQIVPMVTSTIDIDNVVGLVGNVDVTVDIRHSWVGDLQIELEHGGRRELLVLHPGGVDCNKDDLYRTAFDSDLSHDIRLSKSPQTPGLCRFRMQGVFAADGNLSEYIGYPVEGAWKLHVTDLLAEKDNGRLASWGLVIHTLEQHLLSSPAVVPSLVITEMFPREQRHTHEVISDGRITQVTVSVHLSVPYTSQQLLLPTILLEHPDGTRVTLSESSNEFCAYGNYTSVIFDDLAYDSVDYSCRGLFGDVINVTASGMGFGSGMGSTSGSGSGSGLYSRMGPGTSMQYYVPTFSEVLSSNVSIPVKHSLVDILIPTTPLSTLNGKLPSGQWSLVISGGMEYGLALVGWSLRMSREPNIDWSFDPNWTKLTLRGLDSVENYNKLLRSIVYHITTTTPDFSQDRTLQAIVSDGSEMSSLTDASRSILIIHHIVVDLDPLNITVGMTPDYEVIFTEASMAIAVVDENNAILSDPVFNTSNYTLTITLTGYQNIGEEGITVNLTSLPTLRHFITEDIASQTYAITVSSPSLQPIEVFQSALRSTEYYNYAEELVGTNRSILFEVRDDQSEQFYSTPSVSYVIFEVTNDPPVLILNNRSSTEEFSNFVDYREGQGPQALTNASILVLYDNDDDYLEYVTVTILNPLDGEDEILMATSLSITDDITNGGVSGMSASGGLSDAITITYNSSDNVLLLSGRDTIENYAAVVATVTYANNIHSPGRPSAQPRLVSFVPHDGKHSGTPAVVKVTFASVNDPPFLDLNGMETGINFRTTFYEELGAVAIVSPNLTAYDVDNVTLVAAEVTVTNLLDGEDEVLSVMSQLVITQSPGDDVVTLTTIQPTVYCDNQLLTPSNQPMVECEGGILIISGLNTVLEYQLILRTVRYSNLADEPAPDTRLVQFLLNDGLLENTAVSEVSIELINDSPYFNDTAISPNPSIDEDDTDPRGLSVDDIVTVLVLDDDGVSDGHGVAIVMVESTQGQWQYSNGSLWTDIPSNVSWHEALLLDTSYEIRYIPDHDTNGDVTMEILAWDGSDGYASSSLANVSSNDNTDAYSSEIRTITWTVVAINDAPVLPLNVINLSTIEEDYYDSSGDPVTVLLHYAFDVDYDMLGVAVIGQNSTNGIWQFTIDGGTTWQPFDDVSSSRAVVLSSIPDDYSRIRFVPDLDFNGVSSIEFLAWDLTSGEQPGTRNVNTTSADSVIGAFSVNNTLAVITVDPVNDSPLIDIGMTLDTIMEDTPIIVNHGTMVTDIVEGFYTDVDVQSVTGVVVVNVNNQFGVWQYTCDTPPFNWTPFIGDVQFGEVFPLLPELQKATLLLGECRIRYLPESNFNTELDYRGYSRPLSHVPHITVLGWDTTVLPSNLSGSYGNDVSYHADSITNDLSPVSQLVHINIASVNDLPRIVTSSLYTVFVEDGASVSIVGTDLEVIDVDNERLMEVTVTIYGSFTALPTDDTSGSGIGSGIEMGSGSGIGSEIEMGSTNGMGSGVGIGSGSRIGSGIEMGSANGMGSGIGIGSGDFINETRSRRRRTADDSEQLSQYCDGEVTRIEELLFDTSGTDLIVEVISLCPYMVRILPNMTLTDAPASQFEKVLRTSRYSNIIEEPLGGIREVSFVITDIEGGLTVLNSSVLVETINDLPLLDLNSHIADVNNFVQFTEGNGPLLLSNASGLTLIDHDNNYLQSATVTIAQAPDADHEILAADTTNTSITSYYDNTTFTLTLMGTDTVDNYAAVLWTVTYDNTYADPGHPDESQREILFFVSDGLNTSEVAISYVSFTGVNNKPMLDVNGNGAGVHFKTTFIEEGGAIPAVDPLVIVHDEDNTTLEYLTVQIINPLDGQLEILGINADYLVTIGITLYPSILEFVLYNATNIYNSTSSVLTLTGFPTLEEFQIVLSSVTYNNIADEPNTTPRVLQFNSSDGLLESDVVNTTITMELVNDSPRFRQGVQLIEPSILEDETDNEGITVRRFAYSLIEDDDVMHERGVAIVSVDSTNGQWEYQVASGNAGWQSIPNDTTINTTRLLRATTGNRVRFVPNLNFHGTTSITFVAWDASDGLPDGSTRVATSLSKQDAFSSESHMLLLRVIEVNDAPILNISVTPEMSPIPEDSVREYPSIGDDVTLFLSALQEDVDRDTLSLSDFGIAITSTDTSNGRWQVTSDGGIRWVDIGSPTSSSAVLLRNVPEGANRVRFYPDKDYNGVSSFTYKIWDLNSTELSGTTRVDTNTDPITGPFSIQVTTATLIIEPVNDSPVLTGGNPLPTITEDVGTLNNPGIPIAQMVRGFYSDVDAGFEIGVAVVEVDIQNGVWEYTCDIGSNVQWRPFTGGALFRNITLNLPYTERATLLVDRCFIRFVPNDCFNTEYDENNAPRPSSDAPFIRIRGWDNTGVTRGYNQMSGVDTTSSPDDHTNAFSENISMVTIRVTSVNDPPVLTLGEEAEYETSFIETIPPMRIVYPVTIVSPAHLSLTDCDHAHMQYALISFIRHDNDSEELLVNVGGTGLNYSIVVGADNVYTLRIESSNTFLLSTIEEYIQVLQTLQYHNIAEEPNDIDRTFIFSVYDGIGFNNLVHSHLRVILINDPPEFDLNTTRPDLHSRVMFVEGQGAVALALPGVFSLVDYDNATLNHIRISLLDAPDMDHEILDANVTDSNISKHYGNSQLLLTGPATVDEFIVTLATVTYNNTFADPGNPSGVSREIEFIVNDGLNDSIPAIVYLSFMLINNPPFVDVSGDIPGVDFEVTFEEERGPINITHLTAFIEDIDNVTLEYIEVVITPLLDGANERLSVSGEVERIIGDVSNDFYSVEVLRPEWSYNVSTGSLLITGLDSVVAYQEVLKTVTYNNIADEPNEETRQITFTVSDGLLLSDEVFTNITIVTINDSPFIDASAILRDLVVDEDQPITNNSGWSLAYIADHVILDDDVDSISGVAIVSLDISAGRWQYSVDGDNGPWIDLNNNTSLTRATVLTLNDSFNRIRFLPNRDFNGEASFSFKAWDVTNGYGDGTIVDATSLSPIDAYSSDVVDTMVTVLGVNDAPLLQTAQYYLTTILEDDTDPRGDMVSVLTANVTDVDLADVTFGVAIVMLDEDNGVWQFSVDDSISWVAMDNVGLENATLLDSQALVRFLPSKDFNGFVIMTFIAWDLTSGEDSGTMGVNISLADEVTGAYSINSSTATLYIEPINDSPVISDGAALFTILEDTPPAENVGTLVSDIVSGSYFDVDVNHSVGIAVVGVDLRNGVWEWSCPQNEVGSGLSGSGSGDFSGQKSYGDWEAFIGDIVYGFIIPVNPRPERATLLAGNCRVRFLPNLHFNILRDTKGDLRPSTDTPELTFIGWDGTGATQGLSGRYGIDTTYNIAGNLNEFSTSTRHAIISITSVNDLPVISISPQGTFYTTEFIEDSSYVRVVDPPFVNITDDDHALLESITVTIVNSIDQGVERIGLVPSNDAVTLLANNTIAEINTSTGMQQLQLSYHIFSGLSGSRPSSLTLSTTPGNDRVSVEAYRVALQQLVYSNRHPELSNDTRIIQFDVFDLEDHAYVFTNVTILLRAENAPVLADDFTFTTFTENQVSPVSIASFNLSLSDEDHNEFFYVANASLRIHPVYDVGYEYVTVNFTVALRYSFSYSYNATSGRMVITGAAPVNVYQSLLRTSVYYNDREEPTPGRRFISTFVTDTHGLSSNVIMTEVQLVVINDQTPEIITQSTPFIYTEHGQPISVASDLLVRDNDSGDFPQYDTTITLTNYSDIGEEFLNITVMDNVTLVQEDNFTALMLEGPAPLATFQQILRTLTYVDTAEEPTIGQRIIELQISDGNFTSEVSLILVNIGIVNDLPVIDLNGPAVPDLNYMVNYVEGEGANFIVDTSSLTVSDNDHDTLVSVDIILTNPLDTPLEILDVTIPDGVSINKSYDNTTGVLELSGEAYLRDYQEVLRTTTYSNMEALPGRPSTDQRLVMFIADDGENYGIPVNTTVTFESVNDPPILDLNGEALGVNYNTSFTEEGDPVSIASSNITVFDIDNDNLSFAIITISNYFDDGKEFLLVNDDVITQYLFTSYDYSNGVLQINGSLSPQEFADIIRNVSYQNVADEPDYTPRLITIIVNDGLDDSLVYNTTVAMVPVNDPPRLFISGYDSLPTEPPDVMSGSGTEPGLEIDPGSGTEPGLEMDPGSGIETGSGMNVTTGSGFGSGEMGSGDVTSSRRRRAVSEEVRTSPFTYVTAYTENEPAVSIVDNTSVAVEDDDDLTLPLLNVTIINVLNPSNESLFFDTDVLEDLDPDLIAVLGPYTAAFCPYNGVRYPQIIVMVNLTLNQWANAIKSLKYCNTDNHTLNGTRIIEMFVEDHHGSRSDVRTSLVNVTALNDAPFFVGGDPFIHTINEDHNITIPVLHLFGDAEEQLVPEGVEIFEQPELGLLVIDNVTGNISYYPQRDDYGNRTFRYRVCDSEGDCSRLVVVTIMINPINDPPYPIPPLQIEVEEDTTFEGNATDFFGDVEDDLINGSRYPRVISATTPSGSWRLSSGDTQLITYAPLINSVAPDSVTIVVADSNGANTTMVIDILVIAVNDLPQIIPDYPDDLSCFPVDEDTPTLLPINVIDVEDRAEIEVGVAATYNGSAIPNHTRYSGRTRPEIVGVNAFTVWDQRMDILYTPDKNYYGESVVMVTAVDADNGTSSINICITVNYHNDPPIFGITMVTIDEDQVLQLMLPGDLNVTDAEDILSAGSFTIINPPSTGQLTYSFNSSINSENPSEGRLTYTPQEHHFTASGEFITFTLKACDNDTVQAKLCTNQTIYVTIDPINDIPALPLVEITVDEDSSVTFDLLSRTSDVEDGQPPVANITLIAPPPQYGAAVYDKTNGNLRYTPHLNYHGDDYIYYESCDSSGDCNEMGAVKVTVREVNDRPDSNDFTHVAREDDFDLIALYDRVSDNETDPSDIISSLRLSIVDPDSRQYLDEWTTSVGGNLRVYHAHGIVTYEPPFDYVGPDSFTYAVCDMCDEDRNRELGRVVLEPECVRQIEENGNSRFDSNGVKIACSEAVANILITNVDDVPIIRDISVVTPGNVPVTIDLFRDSRVEQPASSQRHFFSDVNAAIYDPDDRQALEANGNGLDLALYNLSLVSDINQTSVALGNPDIGVAEVTVIGDRSMITYTPAMDYQGYLSFSYEVCDISEEEHRMPQCSLSFINIFVTGMAPQIVSIEAVGHNIDNVDTDAKLSQNDAFIITFDQATNTPPHGKEIGDTLTQNDIDELFAFDSPFLLPELTSYRYTGEWTSDRTIRITIGNVSYPEPDVRVGEWRVRVKDNPGPCGGFDENAVRLTAEQLNQYCLINKDQTSVHSVSVSTPLAGNFGRRPPILTNTVIRNTAVDNNILLANPTTSLFDNTFVTLLFEPPFSYTQLMLYCDTDPVDHIVNPSVFGEQASFTIAGCANVLSDAQDANQVYADEIRLATDLWGTQKRKRSAEDPQSDKMVGHEMFRRQVLSGMDLRLPVLSEVVLSLKDPKPAVEPTENPSSFANSVSAGINTTLIAEVIERSTGVKVSVTMQYFSNLPVTALPVNEVYEEHRNDLTPIIISVIVGDPDNGDDTYSDGDVFTITFDRDTDTPPVSSKQDIDRIFVFDPPLGVTYSGRWISSTSLEITVDIATDTTSNNSVPAVGGAFVASFRPNILFDGSEININASALPTGMPQCIGINVCGSPPDSYTGTDYTIGLCSMDRKSCRAHQPYIGLEGDFGVPTSATDGFNFIIIIIVVIVVIGVAVVAMLVFAIYRHRKKSRERKETARIIRRWEKAGGKTGKEGIKDWNKPPDVTAMRDNPDPFRSPKDPLSASQRDPFGALPILATRPPTALSDSLPPVPSFRPRADPRIPGSTAVPFSRQTTASTLGPVGAPLVCIPLCCIVTTYRVHTHTPTHTRAHALHTYKLHTHILPQLNTKH